MDKTTKDGIIISLFISVGYVVFMFGVVLVYLMVEKILGI